MKCLLVFNHLNDIIYTKYNRKFAIHINNFAKNQGLIPPDQVETADKKINVNVIVQIFSPIVTSQRIMSCQFGNSYTSIECGDGLNITFEEYMGYLFVCIGKEDVALMKRFLNVCITIVRYLCGPDVLQLKNCSSDATNLIDSWACLYHNNQAIYVEAVEQLMVNSDLSSTVIQALRESVDKLSATTETSKMHAMVLVQNKFLALYSSQHASQLSANDILFCTILSESHNKTELPDTESETDSDEEFYSPSTSPTPESLQTHKMFCHQIMLTGSEYIPKCQPHAVYIFPITEGVNIVYVIETGNPNIAASLYESFLYLHIIQTVQIQRDVETLRPAYERFDTAVKKLCEGLKRLKNTAIEQSYKQLLKKWEFTRKKYVEFIKNGAEEALLRAETSVIGFLDNLKEVLNLTSFNKSFLFSQQGHVEEAAVVMRGKLDCFNDFLKVKAIRNFSLGSDSLTINKYLEEFPGLVHFLYVDRTSHRVTAPTLDFTSEETNNLTKKKIWAMIDFSRSHLQEGHLSLMWKDTTFNYAYFVWFEDTTGSPMKPTVFPTNATKALPQPGIICGDFYQKLKEICFPKLSHTKIRCYELYCIHLGLVTASVVLEHTRRLSATIWELRGHPNHPIDLL